MINYMVFSQSKHEILNIELLIIYISVHIKCLIYIIIILMYSKFNKAIKMNIFKNCAINLPKTHAFITVSNCSKDFPTIDVTTLGIFCKRQKSMVGNFILSIK